MRRRWRAALQTGWRPLASPKAPTGARRTSAVATAARVSTCSARAGRRRGSRAAARHAQRAQRAGRLAVGHALGLDVDDDARRTARVPRRQAAARGRRHAPRSGGATTTSRITRRRSRETFAALRAAQPGRAHLGDLRAAFGLVLPPGVPGRLRPRLCRRRPGRDCVGVPLDAAGRGAAVGRSTGRGSSSARAGARGIFPTSTRSSATVSAEARPATSSSHVQRRVRRHSRKAARRRSPYDQLGRSGDTRCSSSWSHVIDPGRERARHRPRCPAARAIASASCAISSPSYLHRRHSLRPAADRPWRARASCAGRGAADDPDQHGGPTRRHCGRVTAASRPGPRAVAESRGCTPDEVIARHAARDLSRLHDRLRARLRVHGTVDSSIAAPRRRVAARASAGGSVGDRRRADRRVSDLDARRLAADRTHAMRSCSTPRTPPSFLRRATSCGSFPSDRSRRSMPRRRRHDRALHRARAFTFGRPACSRRVQDPGAGGTRQPACRSPARWTRYSHRLANVLVGNAPAPRRSRSRCLGRTSNSTAPPRWRSAAPSSTSRSTVRPLPRGMCGAAAGARLQFGRRRAGARAYLAVRWRPRRAARARAAARHTLSAAWAVSTAGALVAGDRLRVVDQRAWPPASRDARCSRSRRAARACGCCRARS